MKHKGFGYQIKVDSEFISYKSKRFFRFLSRFNKFNHYVELPLNVIATYEVKSYFFFLKGLSLKIKSQKDQTKMRRIRPINISFLPAEKRDAMLAKIDKKINSNTTRHIHMRVLGNCA